MELTLTALAGLPGQLRAEVRRCQDCERHCEICESSYWWMCERHATGRKYRLTVVLWREGEGTR